MAHGKLQNLFPFLRTHDTLPVRIMSRSSVAGEWPDLNLRVAGSGQYQPAQQADKNPAAPVRRSRLVRGPLLAAHTRTAVMMPLGKISSGRARRWAMPCSWV